MRRTSLAALVVALTWATAPATPARATNIDSNLAASPATQANGGGCYPVSIAPGLLDMLVLINPEWSAVDPAPFLPPDSEPVTIHGSVALAKVNEAGDFPGDHVTDDQNTLVNVESPDGFVATGNVGPAAVEAGRTGGYAYRKKVRGGRLSTRTDVWISPDGGGAGDRCFLTHAASPLALLTTECFPLSQPIANVNASNFEFDIVLPPRPPGVTRGPRVRVFDQTPTGLPKPA